MAWAAVLHDADVVAKLKPRKGERLAEEGFVLHDADVVAKLKQRKLPVHGAELFRSPRR